VADEVKMGDMAKLIYDGLRYQDGLIFAQIPTLMAMQAATVTATYVLRGSWSVFAAATIGMLFTLAILAFVEKVRDDRDRHRKILNALLDRPSELRDVLTRKELNCVDTQSGMVCFYGGVPVRCGVEWRKWRPYFTVVRLLQVMCWLSILMDLVVAVVLHHWTPPPYFQGIDPIQPVI